MPPRRRWNFNRGRNAKKRPGVVSIDLSSEDTDSIDSDATTIPAPGRLEEVLTDFGSGASTVHLENVDRKLTTGGEEGRDPRAKNDSLHAKKSQNSHHTPRNNSSFFQASQSVQSNKNSTIDTAWLNGIRADLAKRNVCVFKKLPTKMLNSQKFTPSTNPSFISKRNNVVKVDLKNQQKYINSEDSTQNGIYTIDLTKDLRLERALRQNIPDSSTQLRQKRADSTNNIQRQSPATSENAPCLAIPVVNLLDPTVAPKLAAVGVRSAIPLSELYRPAGKGVYMVPIVNMESPNNSIKAIGASFLLPIAQVVNVSSQNK